MTPKVDYLCRFCNRYFEVDLADHRNTEIEKKCPNCGSKDVNRVPSITPIHFKAKDFSRKNIT